MAHNPEPVRIRHDRLLAYSTLSRYDDADRELMALSGQGGPHAAEALLWQRDFLNAALRTAEGQPLVQRALEIGLSAPLRAYVQSLLASGSVEAEATLDEAVGPDPVLVKAQRQPPLVL